ncbi:hypothetical protein HHK36_017335 [Tetracentron sinense]|uniref:Pentatricopeptide repeat-containing protein n=1 Tax=Tetracentron sinense TaxID=13715 RepID=A0A834Z516_TETSI|nr:hypothetical protein HHK36_017335 [Tetracentron sinense]
MLHHPTSHDHFTFTYVLKACSLLHAFKKSREIHARTVKSGHDSDIFIQNSLIHLYVVSGDILSARRIFDAIHSPDVVSWTSIISGLAKNGCEEEAITMFALMGVRPNSTTIVSVLSACSRLRSLELGKAVHGYTLRNFNGGNIFVDNAVLDFYAKCGALTSARYLFGIMGKRDVVSWTTMVAGYAKGGCCEEAIGVFQVMVQGGEVEPNEATLINVLSACASLGALSLGKWVHSYMGKRHDVVVDGHVGNALVNMYAKCGDMGMAVMVFNDLKCKDLVSWSIVIGGMALNGHGIQALQLFSIMLNHGISPDGVTFIGLLSACSHAGLVDQGLIFFRAMSDVYGITPEMEHYACMVDMYGRAGLLDEAEVFITDMPVEPDGPVLGALLNAYKVQGNEKIPERISRFLLSTNGASGGTYALLSNMYRDSSLCLVYAQSRVLEIVLLWGLLWMGMKILSFPFPCKDHFISASKAQQWCIDCLALMICAELQAPESSKYSTWEIFSIVEEENSFPGKNTFSQRTLPVLIHSVSPCDVGRPLLFIGERMAAAKLMASLVESRYVVACGGMTTGSKVNVLSISLMDPLL